MIKSLILTSFFAFAFGIEYLDKKEDLKNRSELIIWPDEFDPKKSKFFVHNEIEIAAPFEVVWNILVDAKAWESWYVGAKNVSFVNPSDKVLQADSRFNWETMGLKFPNTTIKEFEPNRLLAWESRIKSIQGYHVWLIIPTGTGCKVITEEAQNGWLTFFEKTFQGKKLHQLHDIWLGELKAKAESL
jgi:uncharacterized protein YndB with AHSA1/START domain